MKKLMLKEWKLNILVLIIILINYGSLVWDSLTLANVFQAVISAKLDLFVEYVLLLIGLWIINLATNYLRRIVLNKIKFSVKFNLEKQLITKIKKLDIYNYKQNNIGDYLSWFSNDINQIETQFFDNFYFGIENFVGIVVSLLALLKIHYLAVAYALVSFGFVLMIPKLFDYKYREFVNKLSKENEKFTNDLKEQLTGYETYCKFNHKDAFDYNMQSVIKRLLNFRYDYNKFEALYIFCNDVASITAQIGGTVVICILAMNKMIPISYVMSQGSLQGILFNAIMNFTRVIMQLRASLPLLHKTILNDDYLEEEIKNINFDDHITFKHLHYEYQNNVIFNDFNLTLKKNKKYAFVGSSGCGKSTLIKLLMKDLKANNNQIFIDNIDINHYNEASLNNLIGYVEQQPFLFNLNLKDNIQFYNDIDIQTIDHYIKTFNLHCDNHISGENGNNLSGGEKQRIALIRTLILNKDILILDESTSAIDKNNREMIEDMILNTNNQTLIYVTHHLDEKLANKFDEVIDFNILKK